MIRIRAIPTWLRGKGAAYQRCSALEEAALLGGRAGHPEVVVRPVGGHPPAGGAGEEAVLEQEGLDDVLEGVARLAERRGDRLDPDRAAVVRVDDHAQE